MILDAKTIKTLKLPPGKTDAIFFDDDLKGFGLRLRSGRRTWVAQYRTQEGGTRRFKIGDVEKLNAAEARKAATKVLAKVTLGQDPRADKAKARRNAAFTLKSVAGDYLASKELELQRGEYRAASFRVTKLYLTGERYFKSLHSMAISTIGLADVALCLNAIERNSGSVTAGRARSALSSLFTWAAQQGLMGENPHNPVIASKRPKDSTPRERVLTDAELAAIWHACKDDDYGKIVRLLALTACRREEIGGVRRSEIVDGVLTLPAERVKNGHEHKLPLMPMALEIIATIPERVGRDHLFGDRSGRGFTRWDARKAELDERLGDTVAQWTPHDLRRTASTWMAEHGDVEPHIIEAALNHYSGHRSGVAGTYNRARYERQIRAALALWNDHVRAIVEGGERKIVSFPKAAHERV
jgi:integrase